jgi:CRP-like cAMP-binding protein
MENEIIKYLTKYISLDDDFKEIITKTTIVKEFKKGDFLLKEGELVKESYFVLKGCVRNYAVIDGEEKTLEFFTEEQPIAPVNYGKSDPSPHYLECIEDAVITINTPEHEKKMFKTYPQFESVCRVMSEVMMANFQETYVNYKLTNPEERYLYILKNRPELIQRVPQYQLASYLGIKPESLSRLKKRMAKKS